jgi:predicted alpha/beta-fold hydrolase
LFLYFVFCAIAGVFVADAALHPVRRPLTEDAVSAARESARSLDAEFADASITTSDGAVLQAWLLRPRRSNGDAVVLLHGVADNRVGMSGYARILLGHGFTVLMPDARAHGVSGGALASYGLIERGDIREWVEMLAAQEHPRCVFGFGESMGAAQLLQSLGAGAHFCAVAAESSFFSFREVACDRMGQPFGLGPWVGRTVLRPLVEVAFLRARWKYGLNLDEVSPENSRADSGFGFADSWAARPQYSSSAFAAHSCAKSEH